jgi:uncharacterized phage-associated protein
MRSSLDLAKHIIYLLNRKEGCSVSNTKVQKILYSYIGFALSSKKNKVPKEVLIDELPNAWDNGPVFPNVYKFIKNFHGSIKQLGANLLELTKNERIVLEKTVDALGKFSAGKLSAWSHLPNSPWDKVYNLQEAKYHKIPLELIKSYFEEEIECIEEFANVKNYEKTED